MEAPKMPSGLTVMLMLAGVFGLMGALGAITHMHFSKEEPEPKYFDEPIEYRQTHLACQACLGACWSHSDLLLLDGGVKDEIGEYAVANCNTHVCTCIDTKDRLMEIHWPSPVVEGRQ